MGFAKCWLFYTSIQVLTHWGRVTHICIRKLAIIGSDNGLSPSHYLNQCWNIVNWTLRNKLQLNWNPNIFVQENAFENVCKMASILSRPQCAKWEKIQQNNSHHSSLWRFMYSLLNIILMALCKTAVTRTGVRVVLHWTIGLKINTSRSYKYAPICCALFYELFRWISMVYIS